MRCPFHRKSKHLHRVKYALINSDPTFIDDCVFLSCPSCKWRGLMARTFRRPEIWNVWVGTIRREAVRFFAVCSGCGWWEEVR